MTIDRIISLIAIIVSFVAVPASGYLSYHFAIKGERRKEYNAIADPIMETLMLHLDRASNGISPCQMIEQGQIHALINVSAQRDALEIVRIDRHGCFFG